MVFAASPPIMGSSGKKPPVEVIYCETDWPKGWAPKTHAARMFGIAGGTLDAWVRLGWVDVRYARRVGARDRVRGAPQNRRGFAVSLVNLAQVGKRAARYKGRRRYAGQARNPGELAASAYRILDRGGGAAELVRRFRLTPATAEQLYSTWQRQRLNRFLGDVALERLRALVGTFETIDELLAKIAAIIDE